MKLNKKKVVAIALAVCLIAILSMGTLAWFTDDDTATNEFMIADSTDVNPEDIFSVDVKENTPYGEEQDGEEYPNILPGDVLKKEAYVENTGHYNQYVRVTITVSDAAAWVNALGTGYDVTELLVGFDASKWTHGWNNMQNVDPANLPEDIIYVLYLKDILPAGQKTGVFDAVQIPTTLTKEQAALFEGGFTIDIKAEAVQTENVVPAGTAAEDAAKAAFITCGLANP